MLRIDRTKQKLMRLQKSALSEADHWERDLQAMIIASPDLFSEEIGDELWLIGQEVRPTEAVPDRIDILAIDQASNAVVIELKRGSHKLQLLQAVSYAGMISRWTPVHFVETLAENFNISIEDARSEIEEHTGSEINSINKVQRIILIAEDFDPALLIAAEWLHESFDVDIRCYRLELSREDNGHDYLTCICIYPPLEIAMLTRRSGSGFGRVLQWASWDLALEGVENEALKNYVRGALSENQENRLSEREMIYRVKGKRRLYLSCRKKFAYVWQKGRFNGDEQRWKDILSEPNEVKPVNDDRHLRFYLTSDADFAAFSKFVTGELNNEDFVERPTDLKP